jgi:acyl-coenzyme A synthetase/AMP-(fatty) acid ligase
MSEESAECAVEPMNSEDMLFLLYTSGSTGKPKGIQHSQAGYLLYTNLTFQVRNQLFFEAQFHLYNIYADLDRTVTVWT